MKIGYQGIKGAYSESAIYRHFGSRAEAIGFETFEDVFEAVETKKIDYGLLPFENTIAGSVALNYDLLLKYDVVIIGEVFLKINHYLLSQKGNTIKNIKIVYSHPHAIEQCKAFIRENQLKIALEYDTAGAAKIVKERGRMDEAAIASELCAKIYGLDILKKDIDSSKFNITKFFIFVRKENVPPELKKEKTSIAFKTKHYPGALINCLQRLSKHNINLTKLESRPVPENPWEYVFYADFEGSVDDENVKTALGDMEASSLFLKILGGYPAGENPIPAQKDSAK